MLWFVWMAMGCGSSAVDTEAAPPVDLVTPLDVGEVRAGVITDPLALFGGVSAEGRTGDIKIYNSQAQFIIQSDRPSSYYIGYGGGLIDADAVREPGMPGRDLLDEFAVMAGLGRLLVPERIVVVNDGQNGEAAEVLVEGVGGPMTLLTGTVENPDLIDDADVEMTICYRLEPDSPLLEVTATVHWLDNDSALQMGGFAMLSDDVSAAYLPGVGFEEGGSTPDWLGAASDRGEVALALFPDAEGGFAASALQQLLSAVGPIVAGFGDSLPVAEGDVLTWHGYVGVGSDLATLSGAWLAQTGQDTSVVSGQVLANDTGVAGARVHLLDESGAPVTMAHTDANGNFTATVPADGVRTAVATGRGVAHYFGFPDGSAWYAPLAEDGVRAASLAALADGAPSTPFAEGYGISEVVDASDDMQLTLSAPGVLQVSMADGRPAVVRVAFAASDPDAGADQRLVPGRPDGLAAQGWMQAGEIPLAAGSYVVTAHRGLRSQPVVETVEITAGAETALSLTVDDAYVPEGVLVIDPHAHAAPSTDGGIPMSERLMVHAANGIDVHVGTDHDNIADYRVLLEPLGLQDVLRSVVADEFSPILRGHLNIYPLSSLPQANGGALMWWEKQQDTPDWFAELREQVGNGIIQLNHPLDAGMISSASYDQSTGTIGKPDFWSSDFDTMEVINDSQYQETFALYLDLINRGVNVAPVGVSDSHGHRSGSGASVTFLNVGTSEVSEFTDEAMVAALQAQASVVSTGPFIDARINGQWAPGQTVEGSASVDVAVYAADFVPVDRLLVYQDGNVVQEIDVDGTTPLRLETSLSLEPDVDASYVLVATADSSMSTIYPGNPSWAMAAAIRVDVDGDGWDAPLDAPSE